MAEDGVLPDWFLRPHKRLGTNYRLLYLIAGLQIVTILISRGDVILLGEAYAFGVVWSFVFNTLSMVVLRFKKRGPREFVVPWNIHIGDTYWPIGLSIVCLIMILSALANLFTKPVATVSGICFAGVFLSVFTITERIHRRRRGGGHHEHIEQFNVNSSPVQIITAENLGLTKPFRKLVAIRSPHNLFMLDKALADTDPQTTDVVVMTAKVELPGGDTSMSLHGLDVYDQHLLTAVVNHAEKLGKTVTPVLVPTNNALHAVLNIAKDLPANEVVVGASNKYTAEEQLDQIAFYWINIHRGEPQGLTVHVVSADRDLTFDHQRRQPHSESGRAPGENRGRSPRRWHRHPPRASGARRHDRQPRRLRLDADDGRRGSGSRHRRRSTSRGNAISRSGSNPEGSATRGPARPRS